MAERYREPGVSMVCLETAQPCKFEGTIMEALGIRPPRPAELADLEDREQRCDELAADPARLREYIADRAIA